MFCLIFQCFFVLFNVVFFCSCENINVQNYKYDLFLMGKLRIAVLISKFSAFRFFSYYKW